MKVGIIGLPQVGKKTLFSLLTGESLDGQAYPVGQAFKIGVAKIRDARFDRLVEMYQPKKSVPATLDVLLLPSLNKETLASTEFLKNIEKCDALCHLVRGFTNEAVFCERGSVDPLRDIKDVHAELILNDLILVEKRLERISLDEKKGISSPGQGREKEILGAMKGLLDNNLPLVRMAFSNDDRKAMSTYRFLTQRPMILILNVDDNKIADTAIVHQVKQQYKDHAVNVMQISAKIEVELSALDPQERETFVQELGIRESAFNQLSALCFEALGLISFFTVGSDEVRAWTTRRNSLAPEAAGAIHSDLQRGFIRAEIMKYADLMALGSEAKLKEAGKLFLKGKDYIVEDGDIMHVRFSV